MRYNTTIYSYVLIFLEYSEKSTKYKYESFQQWSGVSGEWFGESWRLGMV